MTRVGLGYDVHRFAAGRPLVLGGIDIPWSQGLDGHSDADVLTHAMMDALLGAAGLGDIGVHFPPSDEHWRDARSLDLLAIVRGSCRRMGIENIDATILAEAPKIGPYRDGMRAALSEALAITPSASISRRRRTNGSGSLDGVKGSPHSPARRSGRPGKSRSAMRILVQRVREAAVRVDGTSSARSARGCFFSLVSNTTTASTMPRFWRARSSTCVSSKMTRAK